VLVHFTKTASRLSSTLVIVKGKAVALKPIVKILKVILDLELQYKSYIAKTATKGLKAALALKRLRLLSPLTAQQLFSATVALVVDYTLNV
jgi:hypothetical protein